MLCILTLNIIPLKCHFTRLKCHFIPLEWLRERKKECFVKGHFVQ